VRKRKAKRQVDDDQVNNDASRAPEPENLTGAQAEARPEATGTEAARKAEDAPAEPSPAAEPAEQPSEAAATEAAPGATKTEAGEAAGAAEAAESGEAIEDAEATEDAPAGDQAEATEAGKKTERETEPAAAAAKATAATAAAAAAEQAEPAAQAEAQAQAEAAEGGEPAPAEPAEVEDPREAAAAELVAARAEAESYLNDLRRLQAEFDNYRKRTMREQTARIASASQALVARLLPVLDNFELAVSHAERARDFDRMLKGVEMVFGELREVLSSEGLVSIEAEGKPFDPERHEAVAAVEQEGAGPGTVVDVIRKGYEFNGRVLRPAMVKVAR
jgi:molecular chaperone GrpE